MFKKLINKLKVNVPVVGEISMSGVIRWVVYSIVAGVVIYALAKVPYVGSGMVWLKNKLVGVSASLN